MITIVISAIIMTLVTLTILLLLLFLGFYLHKKKTDIIFNRIRSKKAVYKVVGDKLILVEKSRKKT